VAEDHAGPRPRTAGWARGERGSYRLELVREVGCGWRRGEAGQVGIVGGHQKAGNVSGLPPGVEGKQAPGRMALRWPRRPAGRPGPRARSRGASSGGHEAVEKVGLLEAPGVRRVDGDMIRHLGRLGRCGQTPNLTLRKTAGGTEQAGRRKEEDWGRAVRHGTFGCRCKPVGPAANDTDQGHPGAAGAPATALAGMPSAGPIPGHAPRTLPIEREG